MEQNKQIELRSEKVRNIIGQVPPTLLRYGISIIGFALLMLVVISAFIPHQPSFDTEITVTQDENGRLSYTAKISPQAMQRQSRFANVSIDSAVELPLPERFLIDHISDTVRLSASGMWYVALLQPIEVVYQSVKLEEDVVAERSRSIVFSGKIWLERRSLLVWGMRRVMGW